ncbi:hypothetical protein ElyMa_006240100 [Elysia marginata]|uniref:Uncharacterized protein n=1 Tax=Elysia marginata TaxID=1093978 RepID=A0AAV4H974_9GAST|nr:hypothetical protein ElyMa_006240100 [Elysia marginata]
MTTRKEIVQQADLLGYRGEKREEYLKQELKFWRNVLRGKKNQRQNVLEERRGRTHCEERTREDETRNRDKNGTGENSGWNSEGLNCR